MLFIADSPLDFGKMNSAFGKTPKTDTNYFAGAFVAGGVDISSDF
jgi:hypothetical protein